MNESVFSPFDMLQYTLRRWWIMVICMILGGAAGFGFSFIKQPMYESKASLSVSIDLTRTGFLTDVEEDYAIGVVGDVIASPAVLDKVKSDASEAGLALDEDWWAENITTERVDHVWGMRVRSENPDTAAVVANLWLDAAMGQLSEAQEHAAILDGLMRRQDMLADCLEGQSVEPVTATCSLNNLADLQDQLEQIAQLVVQEKREAQGILPAMGFVVEARAQAPFGPVRNTSGGLTLAGMLAGFVTGVFLLTVRGSRITA